MNSKNTSIKGLVISLERGGCFGPCPIYDLKIYGNGKVVYNGKYFVKVQGKQTTKITQEKIQELLLEFEKINYFSLKDKYDDSMVTCQPSVTTSISVNGKHKSIYRDEGDSSVPRILIRLEKKIDKIVNSKQWIV